MPVPYSLGLFNYSSPPIDSKMFSRFHDLARSLLADHGIAPTHFAADGNGQSGKLTKMNGAAHKRLIANGFTGLNLLTIHAVPEASDAPAYDSTASLHLGSSPELGVELILFSNDHRLLLDHVSVQETVERLTALHRWDFGYATHPPFEQSPYAHIAGFDDGTQSEEECERLQIWYDCSPAERVSKMRNIYPINLLNAAQLSAKVGPSETLREVFQRTPGCVLKAFSQHLWLLNVEPEVVMGLRSSLKGSGSLIEGR